MKGGRAVKRLGKAHQTHTLLWWATVLVSVMFGGFLLAVSLGAFHAYDVEMTHFSPVFFLFVMLLTIAMSYRRARRNRGQHYVGPFLCSLLFGVITQFLFFLASPLIAWESDLSFWGLIKMTAFFVIPSLVAFLIIRTLVNKREIAEDNSWFNWHYYLNWVGLMTNALTITVFFQMLFSETFDQSVLGIRGTIWAFYSLVAQAIARVIERRHTAKVEQMAHEAGEHGNSA